MKTKKRNYINYCFLVGHNPYYNNFTRTNKTFSICFNAIIGEKKIRKEISFIFISSTVKIFLYGFVFSFLCLTSDSIRYKRQKKLTASYGT